MFQGAPGEKGAKGDAGGPPFDMYAAVKVISNKVNTLCLNPFLHSLRKTHGALSSTRHTYFLRVSRNGEFCCKFAIFIGAEAFCDNPSRRNIRIR